MSLKKATTRQNISSFVSELRAELEHVLSLVEGSTVALQPNWIPGTELIIGIPASKWNDVLYSIGERVQFSDMIFRHMLGTNKRVLYLKMGLHVWDSTRRDRFRGSRITSMENGSPADSLKLIQTVKLVKGQGSGVLAYEGRDIQQYEHYRLMAHFLRMSLGLSPADIGNFIGRIARETSDPIDANRVVQKGSCIEERLMLEAACKAVGHAQKYNYWTALRKMLTPKALSKLNDRYNISAADRSFKNGWAVLVVLPGNEAKAALCRREPSMFIRTPGHIACKPQVHIIDTPICTFPFPALLGFNRQPSKRDVDRALDSLLRSLELHKITSAIITEPFAKEQDFVWFRPDGILDVKFKDQVLSPHLRTAIARSRGTPCEWKRLEESGLFMDDRRAIRWVFWVRQSNEDGIRARDTMPRQLTTLLTSTVLSEGFRDGDVFLICAEICSSNKHPLGDRRLWNQIRGMSDMPMNILTVNPDRMTRREAEVDKIMQHVASTGGIWYTQGLRSSDAIEDWIVVGGHAVAPIKIQLQQGLERTIHGGFYARQTQVMTRINDAVAKLDNVPTQVNAAASVIRHCVEAHGYQRICIISHTGPGYQTGKQTTIDTSVIRQSEFLSIMTGACKVSIDRVEMSGFSNEQVVNHLRDLPEGGRVGGVWVKRRKTLFIVASVGGLVASEAEHARLRKIVGHGAVMSLLWDYETEPTACEALLLGDSQLSIPAVATWERILQGQKRVGKHPLNLPILQPIIWVSKDGVTHPNAIHAVRHVKSAAVFKSASATSAYQGGALIAPELSERSADNHGLSEERMTV